MDYGVKIIKRGNSPLKDGPGPFGQPKKQCETSLTYMYIIADIRHFVNVTVWLNCVTAYSLKYSALLNKLSFPSFHLPQ